MPLKIKVLGLEELETKLQRPILLDPAIAEAVGTVSERLQRGGKGLGVRRNSLAESRFALAGSDFSGAQIVSTHNWPRVTGAAWTRKNQSIFKSMAGNVVRKAIERIRARWDS